MYSACMVALQIRDVPEEVRDALVAVARSRGQSLQMYLLDVVKQQAGFARNLEIIQRFEGRSDGTTDAQAALEALDEARAEQDAKHGVVEHEDGVA